MRMLLGIVGLLVTLAIVSMIAKTQLRQVVAPAPESAAASAVEGTESMASTPTRDLPRKIQDDLTRAMQQVPARDDDSR
ncbi:MAG: hypothetical protein Q7T97_10895 [Burkholderiaceae bacterium]|nr:hypothetical protein [Burkholderiaceae bacterium]